jgi:hypothetical protein
VTDRSGPIEIASESAASVSLIEAVSTTCHLIPGASSANRNLGLPILVRTEATASLLKKRV